MMTRLVCLAAAVAVVSFGGCLRSSNRTSTHPPADASGAGHDGSVSARAPECVKTSECSSGMHCADEHCVPMTPEGGACGRDSDCVPPLVCNFAKGNHCGVGSSANEPCESQTDCRMGYTCSNGRCDCRLICPDGQSCGIERCVNVHSIPAGAPCAYNANCSGDNVCVWQGKLPWTCQPPREVGQACGHDTDCASVLCRPETHSCAPSCTSNADCPSDEACWGLLAHILFGDESLGECKPRASLGMPCDPPDTCTSGLVCGATVRCVAPAADGHACTTSLDCDLTSRCLESVCAPPGGAGEPCKDDVVTDISNGAHPSCAVGLVCQPSAPGATDWICVAP